jgi:hypothetical protein
LLRFTFAALQYDQVSLFVQRNKNSESVMSKQLTLASALSILALSALALFAPATAPANETGATTVAAAPALQAELPLVR